jgi:hypothetical protein
MDARRRMLCNKSEEHIPLGSYQVTVGGWRLSENVVNPSPSLYDGVYESYSNYNVNSSYAVMTITLYEIDSFTLYIRSYAESYYDYVMVSQLDKTID